MGIRIVFLLISFGFCSAQYSETLINTPKCVIPKIDPLGLTVRDIVKPMHYESCSSTKLLSYDITIMGQNFVELNIDPNILAQYNAPEGVECCYSTIIRGRTPHREDFGFSLSPCLAFEKRIAIKDRAIQVECKPTDRNYTIYKNVHQPIRVRKEITEKMGNLTQRSSSPVYSVLMVVMDSISQQHFKRTMKRTHRFLARNDFVQLKGYNKIGLNTYPNIMGMLAGMAYEESMKKCDPNIRSNLDRCPLIWYDFRDLGYATAYAEDFTPIGTFNINGFKGFTKPPTDYYFKPYLEAAESLNPADEDNRFYCAGPVTSGERILNLAKDFATKFLGHPSFGVFWMNTFSHERTNDPFRMDTKMANFFMDLKVQQVLNSSFVIFTSDHGFRSGGPLVSTVTGWYEERLPNFWISVPPTFQTRYREKFANLKNNAETLTSHYDLYMTLQDILKLSGTGHRVRQSQGCENCKSLFERLPHRNCAQAGIDQKWCTCTGDMYDVAEDDPLVQNATQLFLGQIRDYVTTNNVQCRPMSSVKVLNAAVSKDMGATQERILIVNFETGPWSYLNLDVRFLGNEINGKSLINSQTKGFFGQNKCSLQTDDMPNLNEVCDC